MARAAPHTQLELYHGAGAGTATRLMLLFEDEPDNSQPSSFLSATSQGVDMPPARGLDSQTGSESDSQEFYEQYQQESMLAPPKRLKASNEMFTLSSQNTKNPHLFNKAHLSAGYSHLTPE